MPRRTIQNCANLQSTFTDSVKCFSNRTLEDVKDLFYTLSTRTDGIIDEIFFFLHRLLSYSVLTCFGFAF